MSQIKDLFVKKIDRKIDGVVKADDNEESTLRNEFEEYVITAEVEKSLDDLLEAYINDNAATQNGVWISGFFGSGKSHLLKMLAHLLENKPFSDGVTPLELFKPKCGLNADLAAKLARACNIPSRKIFFNIDQQAPIASTSNKEDALVMTFVKMFDLACGYYGNLPYIARFERSLDKDGKLYAFRAAFSEIAGKPWDKMRATPAVAEAKASLAFDKVYGNPEGTTKGILSKCRADYRISIEDFAREVKDYIDAQGKDFRLNFYVDEVGQFIATSVARMTNLQTIAESLATICKRRAWVFVTSQQDMKHVIGEFDQTQGNDFSKIQARFHNRVSLSSKNVDEVIRKRLLAKKDETRTELDALYNEHKANVRTLFGFAESSTQYKHYADADDFSSFYPFVPYQFPLFQQAIQELSQRNVFEGRHNSVGERSMLGVFQEVAQKMCRENAEVGALAPFDYMYTGIRQVVKSTIVSSLHVAEQNLGDDFAVRVLTALFLVKYVKLFKASKRNLAILLRKNFAENALELEGKVAGALERLERESYIQRNGEVYEFLTDAEKEIEKEIKNTAVDSSEIRRELSSILFKSVMRNQKIHYEPNGQDYAIGRKIDGQNDGPAKELAVNFLSPWNTCTKEQIVMDSTTSPRDLFVRMKVDSKFMDELSLWIKTNKYVSQNVGLEQHQGIIANKRSLNAQRQQNLNRTAQEMITEGDVYIGGERLPDATPSTPAAERIESACVKLIENAYTNLKMVQGFPTDMAAVEKALKKDPSLFEQEPLTEPESEVLNKIKQDHRNHLKSTLKSILDNFGSIPYGWGEATILFLVANLVARGTVNMHLDGSTLSVSDAAAALRKSQKQANITFSPQAQYSDKQLKRVKEFFKDFGCPAPATSAPRDLVAELRRAVLDKLNKLDAICRDRDRYPFLSASDEPRKCLSAFNGHTEEWYFGNEFEDAADEAIEHTENTIDPLLSFMNGQQRRIYDDAQNILVRHRENVEYKEAANAKTLWTRIDDELKKSDVYLNRNNVISKVKEWCENLSRAMDEIIRAACAAAAGKMDDARAAFTGTNEFASLSEADKQRFIAQFDAKKREVEVQTSLGIVSVKSNDFERWISQANAEVYTLTRKSPPGGGGTPPKVVRVKRSKVDFAKPVLETADDVDAFIAKCREGLDALGEQLKREVASGRAVQWED